MAFDIFRLVGRVVLNSAEAMTGLRNVENAATRTGEVFKKVGGNITSAGKSLTTFVTLPVIAGIGAAIKGASDMNETVSKTRVVFKGASDDVLRWSNYTLKNVGLAKGTALDMAATFGDMGTAMGLNVDQATDMALALTELVGDMASFKNMKPEEVHLALTGAYTGETEALKRLGIVMTVDNLQRFATSQGLKKEYKDMTQAEKIKLRYNYITKASANSLGDFQRTQDSAANQMRIFTEGIKESSDKIGELFLPYFTKAITWVNKWIDRFRTLHPNLQKVGVLIAFVAAAIGPLILVGGSLVTMFAGLITIIGAIGAPVSIAIGAITAFGLIISPVIATIGTFIYKTNVLQKSFNYLKNLFSAFGRLLKGDIKSAYDILIKKLGMSRKEAGEFIGKIQNAKYALLDAIKVIKDAGRLIKAIFSEDKQAVINLLIKKFGYSKKEANDFWNKIKTLKSEIVKFARIIKNDGIKALSWMITKVKEASKYIYTHRREIARAIEKVISFATTLVRQAQRGYAAAKYFVSFARSVKHSIDSARNSVKNAMSSIKKYLSVPVWKYGYNLIKSFANGISAGFGYLRSKASSAAGIVKSFLGFHSPTEEGPGKDSDKWGPNLITMLSDTILDKRALLRNTMQKIAGEMDINSKINDIGIIATGNNANQQSNKQGVTLQIINPKFFNQQDIKKMMEPVITRLEFMGFGSR